MKNLNIEIIQRDGSAPYLAIACREGELYSLASVGGGSSERAAVIQAVNAYYNYAELIDAANNPPTFIAPEVEKSPDGARTARVAVDQHGIKTLLREAAENDDYVYITGEKVDGSSYMARKVLPRRVEARRVLFGGAETYLVCRDVGTDEMRTFRVDGISRAEVA